MTSGPLHTLLFFDTLLQIEVIGRLIFMGTRRQQTPGHWSCPEARMFNSRLRLDRRHE